MTKKEIQVMDDLRCELRLAKALRFTEPVQPDVQPPDIGGTPRNELRIGFLYNAPSERVVPACTSSSSHSFGRNDKTDSQQPRPLYSTSLLAWKALRCEAERECAWILARIDAQIEKAASKPQEGGD